MSEHVHRLYDSGAARAVDRYAIDVLELPGYELMSRAGAAAYAALRRRWPQLRRVLVLCGPGNNGGDALVLARLAMKDGIHVRVLCPLGVPHGGDARQALEDFIEAEGRILDLPWSRALAGVDAVVDGLLGIGLKRAAEGALAECIEAINGSGRPRLALDVPTGIDADSGHAPGAAVVATHTVTFIVDKRGLHTGAALDHVGTVELAPLDLPAEALAQVASEITMVQPDTARAWLSPRRRSAHKGHFGHVLVVGGDLGFGGAARLCGEAALRAGAGLVSVATRAEHVAALLAGCPELMADDAESLDRLMAAASVVAVGPGLGQSTWAQARFERAMDFEGPRILDADALNLLAASPQRLREDDVITPHPGEAARLLGCRVADIERDRFDAARQLCECFGCVAVLKGAGTIIADAARQQVCGGGNPGMAVGGMGDVLTGVVAAFRAQGLPAFEAAAVAVWAHAESADRAARVGGERGLLARDVVAGLRAVANP